MGMLQGQVRPLTFWGKIKLLIEELSLTEMEIVAMRLARLEEKVADLEREKGIANR